MRATAILIRWKNGWRWVDADAQPLRIEISQGHSGDSAEVIHKALAELDTYANGQTEITVGINPAVGDPVPSIDWIEGDELHVDGAWREVAALTSTLDDETGRWVDVPQFGVVLDAPEQRIDRTLQNIGGLNKGTSRLTRPVASIPAPNVKP